MSLWRINVGKTGEELASTYLHSKGYVILQRNYRTSLGEIDLIANINTTLVFVEVKARKSNFLDTPLAAITAKKMRNISKVAQQYLSNENLFDQDARFDVISINYYKKSTPEIEHIENAFDLSFGG